MSDAGLSFRTFTEEDLPFIGSSWGSSYYSGTHAEKLLTPDEFHTHHRPLRDRFFAKQNKDITICTMDDDRWHILGWIATENTASGIILHYIYVKSAFRGKEPPLPFPTIASQLIQRVIKTSPVIFTHLTERAARIMAKKPEKFREYKFVPHLT